MVGTVVADPGFAEDLAAETTFEIHPEEDSALEAMMFGQDASQLRQCFLGLVFVVACDQYDVLALAGTGGALVQASGMLVAFAVPV